MFGNLLNQAKEQQEALKEKLRRIEVEAESGGVRVRANAAREILDIHIDPERVPTGEIEQLQDLLTVAVNQALQQAAAREAEETQKLLEGLLPPGLGGLGKLFG